MTNALWLDNLDIIRFEDVKRRRISLGLRCPLARTQGRRVCARRTRPIT